MKTNFNTPGQGSCNCGTDKVNTNQPPTNNI